MCWAEILPFDVTPTTVAMLALAAVAVVVVVVPIGRWLLGPLFVLELSRLAHRGRLSVLRVAYGLALLATLYVNFPASSILSKEAIGEFGREFAHQFLLIQTIAMMLFTPIYFSGAISEEKENLSLDFLLISRLTNREIVLGKFAARMLNLVGLLLVGLPILSLTMLWGGVSQVEVMLGFLTGTLGIFSLGAFSMLCSVLMRRTTHAAIVSCLCAFMLLIPMASFFRSASPVGILIEVLKSTQSLLDLNQLYPILWARLRGFVLVHSLAGSLLLLLGIVCLRRAARPAAPSPEFSGRPAYPIPEPPRASAPTMFSTSPIRGDALLWRERHLGYLSDPYFDTFWLYYAGFLFLLALASWGLADSGANYLIKNAFRWSTAISAAGWGLVLLLRLAGTISRERQQRTLESLLSLPMSRARILYVKWLGAVLRSDRWLLALVAGLALGAIAGAFGVIEAVLFLFLALSWAAFVSGVSLLTSVLVRTTLRAYVVSAVAVIAVFAVTTIDARFRNTDSGVTASFVAATRDALSPSYACKMAADFKIGEMNSIARRIGPLVSAALFYFAVGAALAAIALWRFRREERYT
jgi:ABC-type transport system involved in multi-copper enzyme maturation permease subunit